MRTHAQTHTQHAGTQSGMNVRREPCVHENTYINTDADAVSARCLCETLRALCWWSNNKCFFFLWGGVRWAVRGGVWGVTSLHVILTPVLVWSVTMNAPFVDELEEGGFPTCFTPSCGFAPQQVGLGFASFPRRFLLLSCRTSAVASLFHFFFKQSRGATEI